MFSSISASMAISVNLVTYRWSQDAILHKNYVYEAPIEWEIDKNIA